MGKRVWNMANHAALAKLHTEYRVWTVTIAWLRGTSKTLDALMKTSWSVTRVFQLCKWSLSCTLLSPVSDTSHSRAK